MSLRAYVAVLVLTTISVVVVGTGAVHIWSAYERAEQRSLTRLTITEQGQSLPVLREAQKAGNGAQPVRYTATAYSHGCAMPRDGMERAPRPAANGEWPIPGRTLAADWRLHPPGSVLLVGGKPWRVTDRGHAIRGRRLDLFFATCAEAREYGRRVVSVANTIMEGIE